MVNMVYFAVNRNGPKMINPYEAMYVGGVTTKVDLSVSIVNISTTSYPSYRSARTDLFFPT